MELYLQVYLSMLKSYYNKNQVEAGCDEAGRGCLAGPVFAAAVILPPMFTHPALNDSKLLSAKTRYILREIIESEAHSYAIASASPEEIDSSNILKASILAMQRAVSNLKIVPGHLLIDANQFKPYPGIDHTCIVKGDSIYMSIAAASVLAKTYRDDYMINLHESHPEYSWNKNKGYPTREHKDAIKIHGITELHRKSFNLNEQLKLGL